MANVDIIVRTIDQTKAGFTAVKNNLLGVGDSAEIAQKKMAILGTIVTATTALIADSYKSYSELAESIRDLSLVSGESATNTSRFIQVLDDYQITAADATAVTKKLKEDGLTPTIETLAMLSDQFRGIQDPAERMDFVYDKLGKSGAKWVNVLNQGSAALLANADAINKNLILSDMEIKMYEIGRLAIDEKRDAVEAFKVELGQSVGNVLAYAKATERANQIFNENSTIVNGQRKYTIEYSDALGMAIAEQLKAADAAIEYKHSLEEEALALKEVSLANKELINEAINITQENERYLDSQKEIKDQISDLQAEKDSYYSWEVDKIQATQDKIDDLNAKYDENAEAFIEATKKKITMAAIEAIAMQDGVAGYSEAEYLKAKAILETTDTASAAAFEQAQAQQMIVDALIDGTIPSVEEYGKVLDEVSKDGVISVQEVTDALNAIPKNITATIDIITNGAPPNLAPTATTAPKGTHRRARGGDIWAGDTVLVGEEGPELLYANENGRVVPGERMGGNPSPNEAAQNQNAELIAAIQNNKMDERKLARYIVNAIAQAGG